MYGADERADLIWWSREEMRAGNRTKASKLLRIRDKMRIKFAAYCKEEQELRRKSYYSRI